ncbi:MAG TPA: winged helix-turn-helix transcriptional regulator [Tissierellia bacterium]|jgi:DNA-binding MarR family transcriptional regulator|nr:winged helix-turn-helix transcriptional regulator [Sedimentibacter sp.]HHZ00991.1 winged helix-turn-helix transcriptional regulator [Tissierellia bacterium]
MKEKLLKKQLWDMIRLTSTNFETAFKPIVEIHGLTTMQSRVLIAINEFDGSTVGSISRIIEISSPNASSLCKKLEKDGFIVRERSSDDERVVTLKLTEKGEKTLHQINSDLKNLFGPIIEKVPEEDFETMISGIKLLNKLLSELEKAVKEL